MWSSSRWWRRRFKNIVVLKENFLQCLTRYFGKFLVATLVLCKSGSSCRIGHPWSSKRSRQGIIISPIVSVASSSFPSHFSQCSIILNLRIFNLGNEITEDVGGSPSSSSSSSSFLHTGKSVYVQWLKRWHFPRRR